MKTKLSVHVDISFYGLLITLSPSIGYVIMEWLTVRRDTSQKGLWQSY